ncbi:MAG: HU family DNA-binding protein [Kiritimatiellae bacterium]|nr:HU family DNA-binding protein [Kiritimatiellia bacterium]
MAKKVAAKPAPKAVKAAKPAPKAAKPAPKAPAKAPAKAAAKVDITTKAGLIATIAEQAKISKAQAADAFAAVLAVAYKAAKAKEGYTLPGLVKLQIAERKARTGRNPITHAAIKIPKTKIVKVKVLKAAKDAILGKK